MSSLRVSLFPADAITRHSVMSTSKTTHWFKTPFFSTVRKKTTIMSADPRFVFTTIGTFVASGACIVGCGTVTCSGPDVAYGNGTILKVGVELGGREIAVFADLPFDCTYHTSRHFTGPKTHNIHIYIYIYMYDGL
jgi:hypothetical protein